MKMVHSVAFGISAFFAMNCGSGEGGAPEPADKGATQQPASGASSSASASDAVKVTVAGHTFDPPEVRIKAGQTVQWVWVSGSHNVVSGARCVPDGKFSSGAALSTPPATFERRFDAKGSFPYYCDPHCEFGMTGTVVVE